MGLWEGAGYLPRSQGYQEFFQEEEDVSSLPRRLNPFVRVLIVFIVYQVVTYVVLIPLGEIVGTEDSSAMTNVLRFVAGIVYTACLLLFVRVVDRRPLSVLRLKPDANAAKAFLVTLLLTGAIVIASSYLAVRLTSLDTMEGGFSLDFLFSGFMAAFFLQGFPEEVAFRGVMVETLEATPLKTMVITSLVFMLFHWHFIPAYVGAFLELKDPMILVALFFELYYPFIFGALAFLSMYLFRSLWGAVAVHFGIHIFGTVVGMIGLENGFQRTAVICGFMTIVVVAGLVGFKDTFRSENNAIVYD